jgi:hypothetical protein
LEKQNLETNLQKDRVIARDLVIGKAKTSPLINTDDTDREIAGIAVIARNRRHRKGKNPSAAD